MLQISLHTDPALFKKINLDLELNCEAQRPHFLQNNFTQSRSNCSHKKDVLIGLIQILIRILTLGSGPVFGIWIWIQQIRRTWINTDSNPNPQPLYLRDVYHLNENDAVPSTVSYLVCTVRKYNHKTHSKTMTIVFTYWFSFFLYCYSQSQGVKL